MTPTRDGLEPECAMARREIQRHTGLTGYLGVQTLAYLTFTMFPVLFIAFVVDVLRGDEATVGIIRGMAAFGGIAAAVLVGRLAKRADPPKLMMWGYAGLGVVALVFVNITALHHSPVAVPDPVRAERATEHDVTGRSDQHRATALPARRPRTPARSPGRRHRGGCARRLGRRRSPHRRRQREGVAQRPSRPLRPLRCGAYLAIVRRPNRSPRRDPTRPHRRPATDATPRRKLKDASTSRR